MILPFLAIALLIVVTLYSAIVSFRERPETASPSWIFPAGVSRSGLVAARFFACASAISLVGAIGVISWITLGARSSNQRSLRFLIPQRYAGWVRVDFGVPGEPALPVEGGQMVLKIPPSGLLKTSSPEPYGWATDYYFYYSPFGVSQLPSGQGGLIWGKINGEEMGISGKRAYEEFFVGTEQQYKDQADGKSGPP